MATAARKISVINNPAATDPALGSTSSLKVTYANAAAGDITQLSTNKVLLVIDVDGTTSAAKQEIIAQAKAAVAALEDHFRAFTAPSHLGTDSVVTYRQR